MAGTQRSGSRSKRETLTELPARNAFGMRLFASD
jgi:hypothetical protein